MLEILSGLPACGKTTYAKKEQDMLGSENVIIIDADKIMLENKKKIQWKLY